MNCLERAAVVLISCFLLCGGCAYSRGDRPTPEAAKRFLKLRGYEFNDKSFLRAAADNDVAAVNGFLAAEINPDVKDETSGATALIGAAANGNLAIVEALLKGGADPNAKDNAGYTAVLRAVIDKHDDVAEALLRQPKLELNAQGTHGENVLMSYVWRERVDVVKNLLERGANPNLSDGDGDTSLHGAAQKGNIALLNLLLDAGADPNAKNKLGGTPLMWAGVYGHEEAARLLLEKGAKTNLKDNEGMTAAAWAVKNKREGVARLLRDAEKKH